MQPRAITTVALLSLLTWGCASSPNLSNDPSQGGFIGGVTGLLRGDYEARVKQRKQALATIRKSSETLKQINSELSKQEHAKKAEAIALKKRVSELDAKLQKLSLDLNALEGERGTSDEELKTLRHQIEELKSKVSQVSQYSGGDLDVAQLEEQKAQLEKEYDALLKVYLALVGE